MPRVALVTCVDLPEPDPDRELLLEACLAAGMETEYAAWDDAGVDWSVYDVAVVRSSWNYYERPDTFRDWITLAREKTRLLNPPDLMLGNIHKGYLLQLEARGIPVAPTRLVTQGEPIRLADIVEETDWKRFVVKPAISASSFKTRLFSASECGEAQAHLDDILADRDALVQRFMPMAAEAGELSLIHIAGEFSHAVIKHPRFSGDDESVSESVRPPTKALEIAASVLGGVSGDLYARVDLMKSDSGAWVLSELELIEPSLYFLTHQPALPKFAAAVFEILTSG